MIFENLSEKLSSVFKKLKSKGKLSQENVDEAMREIRVALLEADVNYKVTKDFIKSVTQLCVGEKVFESLTPAQHVIKIVNDELTKLMGTEKAKIKFPSKPPCVIMMCGLQGSGKTTHCAKLAYYFKSQGHRPLLVACDIYRPAAITQLQVMGSKAGADVFEMGNINPVEISKRAIVHAKDYGYDVVIIDTAGRLHVDEALMDELRNIKQEVQIDETLLVVDAMIGQDSVNIAKSFNDILDIDGVILTKLDGDTRGGAALSIKAVTGKPIKFVGIGEKIDALEPFYPDRMASRILGMGDILSLIEKSQMQLDEEKASKLNKKLEVSNFDLNDLLDQMMEIKKLGSLQQIMSMLPGVGNKIKNDDIDKGEIELKKVEVIISSMTTRERSKPDIINASRKRRIARGSGTEVQDINRLLKRFDEMRKVMKQFGNKKNMKKKRRSPMFPGFMGNTFMK